MEKLLGVIISRCYDCSHYFEAKILGLSSKCKLRNKKYEHGFEIPSWCPLPDASQPENVVDGAPECGCQGYYSLYGIHRHGCPLANKEAV